MTVILSQETNAIYDSVVSGHIPKAKEVNTLVAFIRDRLETKEREPTVGHALDQKEIVHLFFDLLAAFPETNFDRRVIGHGTKLEHVLAENWCKKVDGNGPSLHMLRSEYVKICASPDSSKQELGDKLVTLIEKEALFALSLGVRPDAAGATSTAFFLHDLQGKKIAIYKPDDLSTAGKNNPKIIAKITRWLYKSVLRLKGVRQTRHSVGEVFSYKASGSMGHFMVPPTKIVHISSQLLQNSSASDVKRGSLQVFIDNLITAEEKLQKSRFSRIHILFKAVYNILIELLFPNRAFFAKHETHLPEKTPELDKKIFLVFAIFDFITGQVDRHFENWTLRLQDPDKEQDSSIEISATRLFSAAENGECIVAIDNGASAPIGYINELEALDQYLWTELSLADISIPDTIKEIPLKAGWQKNILEDFLRAALSEDLKNLPSHEQISDIVRQIVEPRNQPISKKEIITLLQAQGSFSPKLLSRLTKTISQALAIKERINVVDCFINPPEQHKQLFTLKRLGSIHTRKDYSRFWNEYQALQKLPLSY